MPALTISQTLRAAADLIEPEGRWTQGVFARDLAGKSTDFHGEWACCWCARGAIYSIPDGAYFADDALEAIIGRHTAQWNDDPTRTQSEVVAKLREAADLAERQGQ